MTAPHRDCGARWTEPCKCTVRFHSKDPARLEKRCGCTDHDDQGHGTYHHYCGQDTDHQGPCRCLFCDATFGTDPIGQRAEKFTRQRGQAR